MDREDRNMKINAVKKISVVGLGKLGLCFAAAAASRGIKTLGVDINDAVVESINNGISPIIEPGLQEFISKHHRNLVASKDHEKAIRETDITFIVVATPSNPNGNFSNKFVESALKSLSTALLKSGKDNHLFVISSTVMPTSSEKRLIPLIEKYSKRKINKGFGVCYVPDFVALGTVIRDFLNPDMVVIGQSSKLYGDIIEKFYKMYCHNKPEIVRMSIISAEIAKVSLNAYITAKISFANMLGNLCEKIPGANADDVSRALGCDKRISPLYMKAGLAYGGT